MNIVGICGSLRKQSYNLMLLNNFRELLPKPHQCEIFTLHDVPLYNEDVEAVAFPAAVIRLVNAIAKADAILFGCPEYNYSIPGVLKNAIDWVSRHPTKPFAGKTAAIIGASRGRLGTARAQYHLRQVAVFVDLRFMNRPEVMVGEAQNKFDTEGRLNDQSTVEHLMKLVNALTSAKK